MSRNTPDPDEYGISELVQPTPNGTPAAATETPISVEIIMRIGTETKAMNALAATNADGYKVARGLLNGLRDDAADWLVDQQS